MLFTDCFLRFPTSRSFGFIHTITNFSNYLYVLYNIFLSASVSETIGEQSQYVKNKAFNDQYYRDLIVKYLEQYGSAKKRDVRELLWDKLPEVMDDKQKESKVRNLLAQMRRMGIITTDSENQQKSSWILVKDLNK